MGLALGLGRGEIGLLAVDVVELLGEALAQRLDVHLEPAGRQRELGAELVLVGAELGEGDRRRGLDALGGQAHGAPPDLRQDHEREDSRDQEAEREVHDGLDGHSPHSATGRLRASASEP